ncbi:hypothetical protein [Mycolicibacterium sp.]|uniref:hypothetical protein n=1 Tax=Mycolicibacterium sp. TaxID=2320850 RepID=UPI003D09D90E
MTWLRPTKGTLVIVTALGMVAALAAGVWIGYLIGRRADAKTLSWSTRTSRVVLGRQAITLLGLLAASRLERTVRRRLPGAKPRRHWPMP